MKRFKRQLYDFMTLAVNNASEGDLWIYGDIVDDKWYDDDVTPITIRDALNDMGAVGTLNLRINSYGGSCMAGNTIVNLIDNYKRKTGAQVHTYIDGIAASMGSGIAMAGDYVFMAENAIFMIHKPYSIAFGNSFDMEHEAEVLEKVEDTLVKNYMRHFNGTEDELRQLMADESWLTADEALEWGFCDEIVPAIAVAASAKGIRINGAEFCEAKLKERFKENKIKEGERVVEYNNSLMGFGITEDTFKALNMSAEDVHKVINAIPAQDGVEVAEFLPQDKATEFFGKELTAEEILDFAKAGMEIDTEASAKAKAYDKLVNAAIDDAITSGNRAKGESFNETKWKKILASLDYSEIIDQKLEWDAEAKIVNKAGKRVSQEWKQSDKVDTSAVNIDDYKGL